MQLQEQVSTLKHQLDRGNKVINTLEKLEKRHHKRVYLSQATKNGLSVVQTSFKVSL